jgi:hypothetical protein
MLLFLIDNGSMDPFFTIGMNVQTATIKAVLTMFNLKTIFMKLEM